MAQTECLNKKLNRRVVLESRTKPGPSSLSFEFLGKLSLKNFYYEFFELKTISFLNKQSSSSKTWPKKKKCHYQYNKLFYVVGIRI